MYTLDNESRTQDGTPAVCSTDSSMVIPQTRELTNNHTDRSHFRSIWKNNSLQPKPQIGLYPLDHGGQEGIFWPKTVQKSVASVGQTPTPLR